MLTNFRCFGPDPVVIDLNEQLTALIGANASGKTAALLAMLRLFGVSQELRRVRVEDFHVPDDEDPNDRPTERELSVDVVLAFPELEEDESEDDSDAVPEFFQQMAADGDGVLKCRLRLDAQWQADGSVAGSITESRRVVRTLDDDYEADDWSELHAADRARIQMIYVPAARDGAQHLTSFLRGRLWRAAVWSHKFRERVSNTADALNAKFGDEGPVSTVEEVLNRRWTELHAAGTDAEPSFRPVSTDFEQFVGRAELFFEPTESGQPRRAAELSDGQRSLLHIALTATALDIESEIAAGQLTKEFDSTELGLPTLTILAVEEPENSLAPFYLSRIVGQMLDLGDSWRAQMILSSHSPSVLSRVDPSAVRHFRLDDTRNAHVNRIHLPDDDEDAGKYVREAIHAYPELYFARFVVLGEGDSEQVALPILAEARRLVIDRSFVAVVPLGGRHVNHLWRLLNQLCIPHATLLDLDWGREGGGADRIKLIHDELAKVGIDVEPDELEPDALEWDINKVGESDNVDGWIELLRQYDVYFCEPLDLDWTLMNAFWDQYTDLPLGGRGPGRGDATSAVLGKKSDELEDETYDDCDEELRWYRYLFLGRSKPSTHLRVLSGITERTLRTKCPEELTALIDRIEEAVS